MYEHRYKYGKQEQLLDFNIIKKCVRKAKLSNEDEAFFWLLFYCPVRKSEGYERVKTDCKLTASHFIIDFHQRKKHGATTPPLEIPLSWPGVEKIVKQYEKAKLRIKRVFVQEATSETRTTPKGRVVPVTQRMSKKVRAEWLFPNIQSTKAWMIVKRVLGKKYYPHFLRLQGLSEIGNEPSATFVRLKSVSGIKSLTALAAYLGQSKKERDKAFELRGKKFK